MMRIYRFVFLWPLVLLFCFGCQTMTHDQIKDKADLPAPVVERPSYIFHKVMAGETMATIAKWYSGRDSKWREIAEENPGVSPWNLRVGDILKVPVSIATDHTEQSKYSTAPRPKAKKPAAQAGQGAGQPPDEGGLPAEPVFGPK